MGMTPGSAPTLFLAHGSPMLALDGGAWGEAVSAQGRGLEGIRALLVCSAHWETEGPFALTAARAPGVLHDFSGFPSALSALDYPAPGSPDLAVQVCGLLAGAGLEARLETGRPFDHGVWVPLRYLRPEADLPVVQLSLPVPRTPELLLVAGRALAPLRHQGVLVVGSGGLVHNLRHLDWREASGPQPWASAFQDWIGARLATRGWASLSAWPEAPGAREAVPSSEHLDPLFVALGAAMAAPRLLYDGWQLGSLSLRSYRFD